MNVTERLLTNPHTTNSDVANHNSDLETIVSDPRFSAFPPDIQERLKRLSPEAAAAVLASGFIFWIVPGPGTPLILAGGLRLWPSVFHKLANGFQRYFPKGHLVGLEVLKRFLDDLESRFPPHS